MDRVTVYLRTTLFSLGGPRAHVPAGVMVVEGTSPGSEGGAITVHTERMLDERGRELSDAELVLRLPWAKVDHVVVQSTEPG